MSFGIILTPDIRSKAYIQKILQNNIKLDIILFMNDRRIEKIYSDDIVKLSKRYGFDIAKPVMNTLLENNLKFKEFSFVDINNPVLTEYIKSISVDYLIFTGGGILKHDILSSGSKFIHLHPGIVPSYRGSTCFYYSILNQNNAGVTAYIMDEKLDTGDTIYQKKFQKPTHRYFDEIFDPYIRSETLIELFKTKKLPFNDLIKQNTSVGETYYIIHPVLKHISILSCLTDG